MLKVTKAQGQAIVSDSGRWGYQHQGVPVCGVMDGFSYQLANFALGNSSEAACVEIMGQFDFVCAQAVRLMFGNCGANAELNKRAVYAGQVLELQVGDVLRVHPAGVGIWSLLCVQGGVDVPQLMGSRSTCLSAGFGGYSGRTLQAGDVILAGADYSRASIDPTHRIAMPSIAALHDRCAEVDLLAGPAWNGLTEESRSLATEQSYRVSAHSSRMGYRLLPMMSPLRFQGEVSVRSHAVHAGWVQVPPSGEPVVLLSDAQTTGGYPGVACVPHYDVWKFAHLKPGQEVRFNLISFKEAMHMEAQRAHDINRREYWIDLKRAQQHVD